MIPPLPLSVNRHPSNLIKLCFSFENATTTNPPRIPPIHRRAFQLIQMRDSVGNIIIILGTDPLILIELLFSITA